MRFSAVTATLRFWLDPHSRRPLVVLAVVSLAVYLAPLGYDLFFTIPPQIRGAAGQAAMLALVAAGLWRAVTVRPTDSWWRPIGPEEEDARAARWVPWLLRLATVSLVIPLLGRPDHLGLADWDYFLEKYEAIRQTVLVWGQVPWWDPWTRGGFPIGGNPQIGIVSPTTAFVLGFGTVTGLGLATALCLLIAVEGAYRLAWLWLREPWAAAVAAVLYGLNGGAIVDASWGFFIPMSYCVLPWMAYHAFRIGDRFRDGLGLGFWAGFALLNGLHYSSMFAVMIAGVIWLRVLRVQPRGTRGRLLAHTAAAVGVALLLAGWRLAIAWAVMQSDLREHITFWELGPAEVLHCLLDRPGVGWVEKMPVLGLAYYTETTCYVGPLVLLLGLLSLVRGWRWWHALTLICGWLAVGSTRWHDASYYLGDWPIFATMHAVPRWRFPAMLGLGLAVGGLIAHWRRPESPAWLRRLAVILVVAIAADLLVLGHQLLPMAFGVPAKPSDFPGPPVPTIVNVLEGSGYPSLLRGYGVIQGYEPMLSYRRDAPTERLWRGHPDYVGEAWTAAGAVEPVFWSPNRIVFQVAPGAEVHINQNPGSYWRVNGRAVFRDWLCADRTKPFAARADEHGRLVLEIRPTGLKAGIWLDVAGGVLLLGAWVWRRYRHDVWVKAVGPIKA